MSKEEINKEPVFYCKNCLSLKIRSVPNFDYSEYCEDCDSADIGITDIFKWEKLYEKKYGYNFLEGKPKGEDY